VALRMVSPRGNRPVVTQGGLPGMCQEFETASDGGEWSAQAVIGASPPLV